MTDAHVHFRDWNQSEKETILHGMTVGFEAGFDTFFDMPNTSPAVTTRQAVKERLELGLAAEKALALQGKVVHYHLYCGLTSERSQISEMVAAFQDLFPRVCGLKMFASHSTGNMGLTDRLEQNTVYETLAALGYEGVLAVHCEKDAFFSKTASTHCEARPAESEVASVCDQIFMAEEAGFKGTLHIAHVSTRGALEAIDCARSRGRIRITCGATAHHILLNSSNESAIVKMNPPLRSEDDRLAIWEGLFDGTIDWVESDHAPHTLSDKISGACGIPGFEGSLLAIRALRKAGMSEDRLSELFCTSALSAFGMEAPSCTSVPEITDRMILSARNAYPFSAWESNA